MQRKSTIFMCWIAMIGGILVSGPSQATWYGGAGYRVTNIRPGGDRPCTLFMLDGVTTADPVTSGAWFVLETTMPGYKESVATLMAAKALGQNIQVMTTGTVSSACGYAVVSVILWP
jgi:hypothetical protein